MTHLMCKLFLAAALMSIRCALCSEWQLKGLHVVDQYSSVSTVMWARSTTHDYLASSRIQDPYRTEELLLMEASKNTMSELESSMATIVRVFHKYSGHKCKLKKTQLKALINNEMSHFIMKIQENEILDQLFADLDQNGDLEIDFQEFTALIAMVTSACHEFFTPKHHD